MATLTQATTRTSATAPAHGEQGEPNVSDHLILQPKQHHGARRIPLRVFLLERGVDRPHLGMSRVERHAVHEPGDRVRVAAASSFAESLSRDAVGHQKVRGLPGNCESRRHDPNDGAALPIRTQRQSQHVVAARQRALPELVAQHDDGPAGVFLGGECATQSRGHALNAPLGGNAAMRVVGYYNDLPGFIDSVYPNRGTIEDVNSGTRTGGRVTFRFEPNENFNITPRVIYQKLETDGYPRIDAYNILGNPYTNTEPAITVGERDQVTQFREGLTDEFFMGDLKLEFGLGGDLGLTSVTTYIDRQVEVVRDASQLTGSVSVDFAVATPAEVRLDSPLIDSTDLQVFSQELRLASTGEGPFQWLVGAFYQQADREYGQNLPTPGYDAILLRRTPPGRDSAFYNAPPDTPYFSDLNYDFSQFALFGEATYRFTPAWALTAGLRYYDFERRPHADLRRGLCRPGLHRRAGLDEFGRRFAARHPRVQPRRRRADHRAGVAWIPSRRHQRSTQRRAVFAGDLVVYGGHPPGTTRRRLTTRSAPRHAWPTAGSPSMPRCS